MTRCLSLLALVWVVGLLCACQHTQPAASKAADTPDPLADFVALIEREPRHVGAHYIAARTAARLGDADRAIRFLEQLAVIGLGDQLEPDDFPGVRDRDAFSALAQRFLAAAPATGNATRWTETGCADLLPEGTAWDARRNELLISSGRLRTVVAIAPDGHCREVIARGESGVLAVLGMRVDTTNDALWIASTAAPFMIDAASAQPGSSLLARIDLAAGRVVATYPLVGSGMLNDLTLAANGDVYVTESMHGQVLRLAAGTTSLVPIAAKGSFEGPNGITVLASGALVVADFHGLWLINAPESDAPVITRLRADQDIYLGGFDGIDSRGDEIVGIQNLIGRGRIWRLAIDPATAHVSSTLLLRGQDDLMNPTTGVWVEDQFLFVADPNLQKALKGDEVSALPAGRSGHRVLALPLH